MSNSLRRNTTFTIPFAPTTRLQANRWLQFATFGPGTPETDISVSTKTNIVPLANTQDDATRLMSIGYVAYLNEQFADMSIPVIAINDKVNPLSNNNGPLNYFGDQTSGNPHAGFDGWFFAQGMHGTAQIKMKLFYALTQIFVIAGNGNLMQDYESYYDMLLRNVNLAGGQNSYLRLLTDIVYSRAMLAMLTYNGNVKADAGLNTHPDENMAREIMQLFSIGLYQMNIDGSFILDSNGAPATTYTRTDIPEHAKLFTGFQSTQNSPGFIREVGGSPHEQASKTLIAYPGGSPFVIPTDPNPYFGAFECPYKTTGYAVTVTSATTFTAPRSYIEDSLGGNYSSLRYSITSDLNAAFITATGTCVANSLLATITTATAHGLTTGNTVYFTSTAQRDMRIFLDYLTNHPNVGPFIAKSLIKFFVTSNPTAGFIKRVATIFNNNGSGIRGDLQAVVKAILLDREAIIPYGINQKVHGRHMTLVDRCLKVARAFKNDMVHQITGNTAVSLDPKMNGRPQVTQQSTYFTRPRQLADYTSCAIYQTFSLQPGQSISVFNFFRPGYTPPGTDIGLNGFTAPELQINTIDAQTFWLNSVTSMCETVFDYDSGYDTFFNTSGNRNIHYGFDMGTAPNTGTPYASGFTVSSIAVNGRDLTGTCQVNANFTSAVTQLGIATRRSDGYTTNVYVFRPIGTGNLSFVAGLQDAPTPAAAVGDIWDFSPLGVLGFSGFPNASNLSGGGERGVSGNPPCIMLFYKLVPLITNPAAPTLSDLNAVIDYLESILMSQPISAAIRALMIQAGQVTATAKAPYYSYSDANMDNYYLNMIMTQAQIRVRRMTAILLASPEFQIVK